MQLLELLYQRKFKNISIIPRKLSIVEDEKIILCGPRGAGKSFLIYDYLQFESYGSYLYIDFDDFRVKGITKEKLEKFCEEKKITTLVLENFDFSFEPPKVLKTIITTICKKKLDGFKTKILYPLDFEEFISFDKKFVSEQHSFNYFSTRGTFPAIVSSKKENFEKNFQQMLKSFFSDKTELTIIKNLSLKQGSFITLLSLYRDLKENNKISKDRFYSIIKKLQEEQIIFLVEKYQTKSHHKKLYMIDFTIRNIVSFEKDFIKRFENIVFLELLKRDKKVFYHDRIDFVVPQDSLGIISMLFLPEEMIKNKIKLLLPIIKELKLKRVKILTLEPEFSFESEGISCEVQTFWSFALS